MSEHWLGTLPLPSQVQMEEDRLAAEEGRQPRKIEVKDPLDEEPPIIMGGPGGQGLI